MHICYICREYPPSLQGGGISSYMKEIAHGMHQLGHQVTVICASDDTRKESRQEDNGVTVIRLKGGDFIIPQVEKQSLLRRFRQMYRFFSYRKRILNAVLQLKDIDIIEIPEYDAEGYYLHNLNTPVIIRLHTPMLLDHYHFCKQSLSKSNWHYYWQGLQELKLMKKARYLTSCSTSLKEWAEQYAKVQKNKIKVIYNPIDTNAWGNYHRCKNANEVKEILFAGTICDWKGCGDLAEACHLLHQRYPELKFRLSLVGKTGTYADRLKEKFGNEPWFNLVGKVKREELMQRYTTADLICFPSWWENMPMVCIEAMLCGGIVLGSSSGGMNEIIEDGVSGFLIEPKNASNLSNQLARLLDLSEEEKEAISAKAQQRIKATFSLDVILKQQIAFYQDTISDYKKNRHDK